MVGVGCACDETLRFGAVDEADGAVVAQQQVAGDVPDRRVRGAWMPLDREQQLVLGGGQVPGSPPPSVCRSY
jgi:hypothetical protein